MLCVERKKMIANGDYAGSFAKKRNKCWEYRKIP